MEKIKNDLILYYQEKNYIDIRGLNYDSINSYCYRLYKFEKFINKDLKKTNEKDIINYFIFLEKNYSITTRQTVYFILKKTFKYLYKNNLIQNDIIKSVLETTNFFSSLKKYKNKKKYSVLSKEDILFVLNNSTKKTSLIIKFIIGTGYKIGQIRNIELKELYYTNNGFVKINKDNNIEIPEKIIQEILNIYKSKIYLFETLKGNKLNRTCVYSQINRAFKKNKIFNINLEGLINFNREYKKKLFITI